MVRANQAMALTLVVGMFFVRITHCYAQEHRPNILIIYADDQSYKTVACEPGAFSWVQTPNIDALARSGVHFAGAYLGSWCMPSRASMLTGLYPHAIQSMRMEGTYPGSTYDPTQCPFWPSVFRRQGYHTAQIGKWHTGTDTGYGRDWDHQIVWNRPKHPENAGNYYHDQLLAFDGVERTVAGYSTDNYTQWACDYIRGEHRDQAKPWTLWLCYGAIHGPSQPAERHKGKYAQEIVPTPADIFPPRPGKPAYLDKTQAWLRRADGQPVMGKSGEKFGDDSAKAARTHSAFVHQMNECVPAIDEGVGKLMETLRETGQLDNTIVIYTADQGFSMGEHGFRTKLAPYDANYRSPLIVRWPKRFAQNRKCPQTASAPDLVVTLFAQAGIALPWKMHGRDLTPLLKDPAADWAYPTLYEHFGHEYGSAIEHHLDAGGEPVHDNVPWYIAIRTPRYKYVRTFGEGTIEEVYDLEKDPEELRNLMVENIDQELLRGLRRQARQELERTDATFAKKYLVIPE